MRKNISSLLIGIGIMVFGCKLVLAIEGTPTEESKIEPQEVSIIGEDKSVLEEEEEEVIMRPLPKVEPPAYTIEKVTPPQIEPEPILPEVEEPKKPITKIEKLPKPTLYSFGLAYGSDEVLLYDFTHTNETKEVGYYFRIDRSRSDGFTFNDISPFKKFSQDYICADMITNFEKWSLRTEMGYLNKDLTLPYQDFVENKLKKSVSLSYEVKVQPESKLSLGLNISKEDIYSYDWSAKNDSIGVHLGFYTPFKKGNPPLSIGTNVCQERLECGGTLSGKDRTLKFYSLYVESKRLKVSPILLLDAKISLDEYKNDFSSSQVDFLLKLHYSMKENMIILGSIERKLSLPTFDDFYIKQDYSGINPAIKPEKSWRYKISGDYRISDELFLEGTIFTQRIENYIIWSGGSPSFTYKPENVGKAAFSGLEFGLRYYFNPKLSQNISYSYINARNKSDGVIPYVPKNRLKMGLRYKDGEILTINLNTEYVDSTYASTDKKGPELDSYFLVNITGEKRINENLFYSFSCENLLGEEYQYLLGYPGQKRRFAIGVRLRF
jgi:outer membrane receptor protein involved in Fe transport